MLDFREFPSSLVVSTLQLLSQELGFSLWFGNEDPTNHVVMASEIKTWL